MALEGTSVSRLDFDLTGRSVTVWHDSSVPLLTAKLDTLGYGARLRSTAGAAESDASQLGEDAAGDQAERRTLVLVLLINGLMFAVEIVAGLLAQSMGLIADSLDMFADAAVYAVALYAVSRSRELKVRAAHLSGWIQMALATGALFEVVRRFIVGSEPESVAMIMVSLLAMTANIACLVLLSRNKSSGAHMTASRIFTANDVIANGGVIVAGVLVFWTGSRLPDLVLGALISAVVFSGAIRILRLR